MRQVRLLLYILLAGILTLSACKSEDASQKTPEPADEPPARTVPVPAFNRDSAYTYVARQVAFGPRVPGTEAHRACRQWLAEQLKACGADVIEQAFEARIYTGETLPAVNIIGQFNPQAKKRVLLAAHWDSRRVADSPINQERRDEPVLGADDGASGVGVLLEVARQLQAHPIDIGVDIVFFDAEDQGDNGGDNFESWGLGAQYWSKNLHRPGYRARYGILLDMVGARNAVFPKEYHSRYFAGQLTDKVWSLAQSMGYGKYFISAEGGAVTDDHYFVNTIANIPMIDIINQPGVPGSGSSFGAHWHTHDDNLDIIDPLTLRAVGQVVLAIVYRENNQTF